MAAGRNSSARVERVGRAEVELAILSRAEIVRELPIELTLAVALPKVDRQKWLVEKAVELGVARIVPLATERANASPSSGALSDCAARSSRRRNNAGEIACWRLASRQRWRST